MNVAAKPPSPIEMGTGPGQSWLVTPDAVDMTRPAPPLRLRRRRAWRLKLRLRRRRSRRRPDQQG